MLLLCQLLMKVGTQCPSRVQLLCPLAGLPLNLWSEGVRFFSTSGVLSQSPTS